MSNRSSVPAHLHSRIDGLLKELRNASRRLRGSMDSCSDELCVLERLYYKGKNQHRSAIFWQHVVEMRRYGSRLTAVDVVGLFNGLRHTFHATAIGDGEKSLGSAWRQVPGVEYLKAVSQRIKDVATLLNKHCKTLGRAYLSFTLMIQSATFLPLVVTLAAIASRLNVLVEAVAITLRDCRISIQTFATLLKDKALPTNEVHPPSVGQIDDESDPPQPSAPGAMPSLHEPPPTPDPSKRTPLPRAVLGTAETSPSPAIPVLNNLQSDTDAALPDTRLMTHKASSKRKKTKRKRDEIDDIFG